MSNNKNQDQVAKLPEENAVKKLRELHEKRKNNVRPSVEMDEIIVPNKTIEEDSERKIAKPTRAPDLDI